MDASSYSPASTSPNSKRFVVEDSITKVTSDGEPHAMMTMVAGLSGLLAAIIILAVLVSMVACRKRKASSERNKQEQQQQQQSNGLPGAVAMTSVQMPAQLAGNLNAAFAESTLTLSVDDDKQQKQQQQQRQQQQQQQRQQQDKENQSPPATTIIVERY
ncbi:hypothetical protein KR222_003406 [Zaprionus bogoriensis]|nr:hypothetical protein KR222_003406 [Zaprionus bogoriensis]